jgi:hypothetical protein
MDCLGFFRDEVFVSTIRASGEMAGVVTAAGAEAVALRQRTTTIQTVEIGRFGSSLA